MITKKNLIFLSGGISTFLLVVNYIGTYRICDFFFLGGHEGNCPSILADTLISFFPVMPLFVLSLIAYSLREETFRAWLKFTYVWIPLTMLLVLTAPEYGNAFLPIEKGTVSFFFSLLYVIISLGILITMSLKAKKKQ